jgi:hypothetical protein
MSRFVLGRNSQLVEIDSNRRLSRIVRNLTEPLHRSNLIMKCDGYDGYESTTPDMVTTVLMLS